MKRMMRLVVPALLAAGAHGQERPFSEQGYLGLRLRDIPTGDAVVSWIFPGPMNGEGATCPDFDIARPDLLVSVDGEAMDAETFKTYVRGKSPGDTVTLSVRRSNQRGLTIPDSLDHEEEVREIEVRLASRDEWAGTIGRPRSLSAEVAYGDVQLLAPMQEHIVAHQLQQPVARLVEVFREWQDDAPDHHSLSRVRAPFHNPFRMPELATMVTAPARQAPSAPVATALQLAQENLDVAPRVTRASGLPLQSMAIDAKTALGPLWKDEAFAERCLALLRVPRTTFYLEGPETRQHVSVIRSSMSVDFPMLLRALSSAGELAALTPEQARAAAGRRTFTNELAEAVTGRIVGAEHLGPDVGWVIVGAEGDNTYDMSKIGAVYDLGGNDTYQANGLRLGIEVIVDFAGDDTYTGSGDQGPGAALLGVSFIDDRAGNDRYEGEMLSAGAACFGAALLLDRDGEDIYSGTEWSIGAACYGTGQVIDLGGGADTYLGVYLCQGVGGPRGFGGIVDAGGRDLYRANGPEPSAYGTAAVYLGFSQGIGFGFRHYAAGGVGMISDLGGHDRYEAGEFSQGGAYYFGLGVLHDAGGRDVYYGNRYGQGFGVHQAHGILVDDAGDDTYWSMTAASQGAGWDVGAGLLLDRAGNDSYQCDGLGQGGAAMQAIGMLVDLGGVDRYAGRGATTQGRSGGNSYHYDRTKAFSFSVLMDLGGGTDWYSRGRENDATATFGSFDEQTPANSGLHGLVIDR